VYVCQLCSLPTLSLQVVNSYYDLATDFYEYGWGQSFHFATQAKNEPYSQALARHEHFLALRLKLNKTDLVLVRQGEGRGGEAGVMRGCR
jgi:sterol 24-C-methyltransferase